MKKEDGEMVAKSLQPTLFVPMTGRAEAAREVQSDPANPQLLNGDFEEGLDDDGYVKGWYYQRQLHLIEEVLAPSGDFYVKFKNDVAGQHAHLMQGFAIDGRKVSKLKVHVSMSCENVVSSPDQDLPCVSVMFYGEDRKDLNHVVLGRAQGTMPWKTVKGDISVPMGTREAILRIGLFGATGSASFDNVVIKPGK
jgi:protein-L-isoaspartate(D-aspartate) O-methyltransferase